MRTLAETSIDLPFELSKWISDAMAEQDVRSVILFGSRAFGLERPWSDWDLALVVRPGGMPSDKLLTASTEWSDKHEAVVIGQEEMIAQNGVYGALGNEIALGVLLDGEDCKTGSTEQPEEYTEASCDLFRVLLEVFWHSFRAELELLGECHSDHFDRFENVLNHTYASDYAVKMMCLSLKLPLVTTREPEKLSESLRRGNKRLADRIRGMDNYTRMERVSLLGGFSHEKVDDVRDYWQKCYSRFVLASEIMLALSEMPIPLTSKTAGDLKRVLARHPRGYRLDIAKKHFGQSLPDLFRRCDLVHEMWKRRLAKEVASPECPDRQEP